jgi:hypothetical protein
MNQRTSKLPTTTARANGAGIKDRRVCENCGVELRAQRSTMRYCYSGCRVEAFRRRAAERARNGHLA